MDTNEKFDVIILFVEEWEDHRFGSSEKYEECSSEIEGTIFVCLVFESIFIAYFFTKKDIRQRLIRFRKLQWITVKTVKKKEFLVDERLFF